MRVVVMGVTGCGKTTVGSQLAASLGVPFADADDFHPAANVERMAAGIPLTDGDRWPWLDALGAWLAAEDDAVVACSALRREYRDRLRAVAGPLVFLHLAAPKSVLTARVAERTATEGHFAGVALLDSQFAALQPLGFGEVGASIDVSHLASDEVLAEARDIVALMED